MLSPDNGFVIILKQIAGIITIFLVLIGVIIFVSVDWEQKQEEWFHVEINEEVNQDKLKEKRKESIHQMRGDKLWDEEY